MNSFTNKLTIHPSKWKILGGMVVLFTIFAYVVSFYYNNTTSPPLFVKTNLLAVPTTTENTSTVWNNRTQMHLLFIPTDTPQEHLLLAFQRHHPNIHVLPTNSSNNADLVFGNLDNYTPIQTPTLYLEPFSYAFYNNTNLTAYANRYSLPATTFRDFMLSSVAQDIFISQGLQSIEPYRETKDTYFDTTILPAPSP